MTRQIIEGIVAYFCIALPLLALLHRLTDDTPKHYRVIFVDQYGARTYSGLMTRVVALDYYDMFRDAVEVRKTGGWWRGTVIQREPEVQQAHKRLAQVS